MRASFVIDTTGQVLIHTAIITEESQFSFGSAVCAWLAREARFEPFVVAGRRYSVRVTNYPFQFSLGPF